MNYPKNGSVVIVDDKIEEVEDLLFSFSKKNVPVYYFSGKLDKLHSNLDNIKIIFLDINYLGHNDSINLVERLDYVVQIISRLITENNGEYIIITWSTRSASYSEKLKKRLDSVYDKLKNTKDKDLPEDIKKLQKKPKYVTSINKRDVKTASGEFDLDLIEKKLNEVIKETEIMRLLILWENNVLESAKNVLKTFQSLSPEEAEQKKLLALFADASSKSGALNKENILEPAVYPMTNLLSDQLLYNSYINLETIASEIYSKKDSKINADIVSKINTFYHIDNKEFTNHAPGNVYKYNDYMKNYACSLNDCNTRWAEDLEDKVFEGLQIPEKKFTNDFSQKSHKKELSKDEINRGKKCYVEKEKNDYKKDLQKKSIPIFLEFTPGCDFIQNKRKKLRLIFGLLVPYNFERILDNQTKTKYLRITGQNIITAPIIKYEGYTYQVFFDLHTITGINENAFKKMKNIFRIRKELLVDIQQKIAAHISRPGYFNMNDYLE